MRRIIATAAVVLIAGCAGGQEAQPAGGTLIATTSTSTSFHPDGEMYVLTQGMNLVVRKLGDDRSFLLTAVPPASGEDGKIESKVGPKCVPAAPEAPVQGPQGGWHGQSAWSPDGRFIAFIAPWKDGDCDDGNDADWDVWMVDVTGLDLSTWIREVVPEKDKPDKKEYYIVGPGGSGLEYYQVTSTPGPEQRPSWASCRSLAYAAEGGVYLADLSSYPGICAKTIAEQNAEREARIRKLEADVKDLEKQIAALGARLATVETPAPATP